MSADTVGWWTADLARAGRSTHSALSLDNKGRPTFCEDPEKTKLQAVACVNEWMHEAGHESSEHLGLSRPLDFRSVIKVSALGIEILFEDLINSLGDQLIGEEPEVRLIVLPVSKMVNKVVIRDLCWRGSKGALNFCIILIPLTEKFPVCTHSVNRKDMVNGMAKVDPLYKKLMIPN